MNRELATGKTWKDNTHVTKYWLKHYVNQGHCSLCGNSGFIDTTGVTTAAGRSVGRKNYCICPNGQCIRFQVSGETPTSEE